MSKEPFFCGTHESKDRALQLLDPKNIKAIMKWLRECAKQLSHANYQICFIMGDDKLMTWMKPDNAETLSHVINNEGVHTFYFKEKDPSSTAAVAGGGGGAPPISGPKFTASSSTEID